MHVDNATSEKLRHYVYLKDESGNVADVVDGSGNWFQLSDSFHRGDYGE